jgi:hypothetical protein
MEVLKDGAAALYGSDAISGVVNFITRNRFEGFELSYDYQTMTEYDYDRPRDQVLQAIAGFGNDRGHVVMDRQMAAPSSATPPLATPPVAMRAHHSRPRSMLPSMTA